MKIAPAIHELLLVGFVQVARKRLLSTDLIVFFELGTAMLPQLMPHRPGPRERFPGPPAASAGRGC